MGYLNDVHSFCGFLRARLPGLTLVPARPRWGTRPASCDQVQTKMFSGQGVCSEFSLHCDLHNQTFSTACGDEACPACLSQSVQPNVPPGRTSLNLLPAYLCQRAFLSFGGPRPPTCPSCQTPPLLCAPRVSVTAARAACPCLCLRPDSPSPATAASPDLLPDLVPRRRSPSGLRYTKSCLRCFVAFALHVQPSPETSGPGSPRTAVCLACLPRFQRSCHLQCPYAPVPREPQSALRLCTSGRALFPFGQLPLFSHTALDFASPPASVPVLCPPSPWAGFRFGEAKNPGPQTDLFRYFPQPNGAPPPTVPSPLTEGHRADCCTFAVVNPTSVLHKANCLKEVGADVLILSETSAVEQTQKCTTAAMRKLNFKCMWGRPVPSHYREGSHKVSLRGYAAGVAVMSQAPCRNSRPAMPPAALETCRIMDCFVRLGALEVRVLAVYGFPLSQADAKARTNELLQMAWERASATAVPCIVAGDFNCPPTELPAGQNFLGQGYQEVNKLHEHHTATLLEPTCRNSTRHDTALIHPALLDHWEGASVLTQPHLFDSHAPLLFRFKLFSCQPCRCTWNLPRPWSDLSPDPQLVERAFAPHCARLQRLAAQCSSAEDVFDALTQFSHCAEDAVSQALGQQHQTDPLRAPHKRLPKAYRGRCQDRALLSRPLPCVVRPARAGAYTPDEEVTSVLGHLKVRQVRRVQTLLSGLRKVERLGPSAPASLTKQLEHEWGAITRAKGYPPSFPVWVLQVAHFTVFPAQLPTTDWVDDLAQYLRFDADAMVKQQAKLRTSKFRLAVNLDGAIGSSKAGFAAMRGPAHPPFTEVPHEVSFSTRQVRKLDSATAFSVPDSLCPCCPGEATIAGVSCQVVHVAPSEVHVEGNDLPQEGVFHQSFVACNSKELQNAFADFWNQLWRRDQGPASQSTDAWPDFVALLQQHGVPSAQLDLDPFDPELWSKAIKRMPKAKATGVCGWAPTDLKLLPQAAVAVLCSIFRQAIKWGLPGPYLAHQGLRTCQGC